MKMKRRGFEKPAPDDPTKVWKYADKMDFETVKYKNTGHINQFQRLPRNKSDGQHYKWRHRANQGKGI